MQCPVCQYTNSRVLESRAAESGKSIRRRRECLQCQHRFTTYERIEFVPITVIKRDKNGNRLTVPSYCAEWFELVKKQDFLLPI